MQNDSPIAFLPNYLSEVYSAVLSAISSSKEDTAQMIDFEAVSSVEMKCPSKWQQ